MSDTRHNDDRVDDRSHAPVHLPSDLVFVLRLSEDCADHGRLTGRIEHVRSGRNAHFGSRIDLTDRLEGLLAGIRAPHT